MKTLKQALSECTDKQLEQIMHLWGMDGEKHDNPKYIYDTLLKRAKDPIAARFVWEYLPEDERLIIYRILAPATRNGIQRTALQKKQQMSDLHYEAAVSNLVDYLLIQQKTIETRPVVMSRKKDVATKEVSMLLAVSESVEALYATGREFFSKISKDSSSLSLDKLLPTLTDSELYELMKHYTLKWDTYYSRADLRIMIINTLLEVEDPLTFLPNLAMRARQLFQWLYEHGGQASMREVRTHTRASDASLVELIGALKQCALIFDTFVEQERRLVIPQDLYEAMQLAKSEPQQSSLVILNEPPAVAQPADTAILYDLATLVGMIYQQPIEPTQSGPMHKRIANKIRPLMHGKNRSRYTDEDLYLAMLLQIARELRIVQLSHPPVEEIKPSYKPGPALEQWAQLDAAHQSQLLLQQWTTRHHWLDIYGADFQLWSPYSYDWGGMEGRAIVLKHLSQCTPGRWYTLGSFLQHIWEEDPFAMRPLKPYARTVDRRKTREAHTNWLGSEGEAYIGMLASTLSELGIVSVGQRHPTRGPQGNGLSEDGEYHNPDVFMLTELGAAALDSSPATQISNSATETSTQEQGHKSRSLVVQPNFELLLLQPDFPTLYSLLPFAQINQIGLVSRLTLTRASLLRGLEAGLRVEQIVQALETHSQKELPQNVTYSLNDWAKNYQEARISQVFLFEVSSEAAATRLCSLSKLKAAGIRQIAPCMLIVDGDINLQEIKRLLDKEGIVRSEERRVG